MFNHPDDIEGRVFDGLPAGTVTDGAHAAASVKQHEDDPEPSLIAWVFGCAIVVMAILLVVFWPGAKPAWGAEISKVRAVDAIIGEAEGEPYAGKLAVACAIRNRGTLKGVYGEHAPRVRQHKYGPKTFVDADRAWEESRHPEMCEFIDGATHWEGTAFKSPYWAKDMVVTVTIGKQRFYRKMTETEKARRNVVQDTIPRGK